MCFKGNLMILIIFVVFCHLHCFVENLVLPKNYAIFGVISPPPLKFGLCINMTKLNYMYIYIYIIYILPKKTHTKTLERKKINNNILSLLIFFLGIF